MMEAALFLIAHVVVTKVEILEAKDLQNKISKSLDNVFLYIGGHHFTQNNLDAESVIKSIDSSATCYWVWEATEFDDPDATLGTEPYRQGSLLIQLRTFGDIPSPLVEHFFNVWGQEQIGVLLTSSYSGQELNDYLQSLLWIQGEKEEAEKYSVNLQNPDFQSTWLKSFEPEKLQEFLGPISSISWLEICGYEMQWYSQINEHPMLKKQNVGWYTLGKKQISLFEKLEQQFLLQELISHIAHTHPTVETSIIESKASSIIKHARSKGINDFHSILLALKVQLFLKDKEESTKAIDLLANKDMPLDIRIQIVEQQFNQVLRASAA